jgi:O-antigen/teichoic acid export membrane protein
MGTKNKFIKAGGLYLLGNLFDKAIAFITVPIFTRLLSTADYGVYSTYASWVSILAVILTLSVGNSVRVGVVDFKESINSYISSIFTLATLSAFVIGIVLIIICNFFPIAHLKHLILLCLIQAYATSIIQTVQIKYMMELKYIQRTVLQCLPNIVVVILAIALIKKMDHDKYLGRIIPGALVFFVIALAYIIYYIFAGRTFYNHEYWRYALTFSLPVIFHSLSTVILQQADKSMITWLRSSSETGIYSLAYQFGMVPLVITTTVENIWVPWFTQRMETKNKARVNIMVFPYVTIVAIICSGVMLVAPEVLKFMTTPDYYGAVYIIPPVVLATFFMFLASVSLDLEYYKKKTKSIAINTLIAAIVNIILNYLFIPIYGATAAAYTTVVSYVISFLMHYIVARHLDPELFPIGLYIPSICIVVLFNILTITLMDYPYIRWTIGILLAAISVIAGMKFFRVQRAN